MRNKNNWRGLGHEPGDAVCMKLGAQAVGGLTEKSTSCAFHERQVAKRLRRERVYLLGQLGLSEHHRAISIAEIRRRLCLGTVTP